MLENVTLNQALAFLFSAAGIAILLNRVPRWDDVPANAKKVIVFVLNLLAPAALSAIKVYIPEGVGDQTLANVVIGVFMAAAAFVIHYADEWLEARAELAKQTVG